MSNSSKLFDAQATRKRNLATLTRWGVPRPIHLPTINPRDHKLRRPEELITRLVIQFALGGLAHGADRVQLYEWLKNEGLLAALSESELNLFERKRLPVTLMNELSWKPESVAALCWVGQIIHTLSKPTQPTPWKTFFPRIPPEVDMGEFGKSFHPRSKTDVLAMVDLYYLLHWALRHPDNWPKGAYPLGFQMALVLERRQALEWTVTPSGSWEDISLDT